MARPRVLVFSGYGLNCEEETLFAFEQVGARGEIVHVNDLVESHKKLSDYQILAFPGGFSYGDDTGAGNAYGQKIKNHLWEKILAFVERENLVIGICNGFQILVNLGLLPALDGHYGEKEVTLLPNKFPRYLTRWVDLLVEKTNSPWLWGIKKISLPIAHGEGRFYAPKKTLSQLKKKRLIGVKYTKGEICRYFSLPPNPNGSQEDIAGILDETGRIFGLMPHPERAIFFHHLPHWTFLKEKFWREGKELPQEGPGRKIFQNAVNFFSR